MPSDFYRDHFAIMETRGHQPPPPPASYPERLNIGDIHPPQTQWPRPRKIPPGPLTLPPGGTPIPSDFYRHPFPIMETRRHQPPPPPASSPEPPNTGDIPPRQTQWLWPGKIPRGHVPLLCGPPGAGKSLLALDLVA